MVFEESSQRLVRLKLIERHTMAMLANSLFFIQWDFLSIGFLLFFMSKFIVAESFLICDLLFSRKIV